MHDDEVLGKAYDARLMRRLLTVPVALLAGGRGAGRIIAGAARSWRSPT